MPRPKRKNRDYEPSPNVIFDCVDVLLACVQTSLLPQKKSGEETSVNRRRLLCSGIHLHKLFFIVVSCDS